MDLVCSSFGVWVHLYPNANEYQCKILGSSIFFMSECFMGNASSIHVCLISGKFREDSYIQQINTLSVSKAFRMPVMCGSVSLMEHILF